MSSASVFERYLRPDVLAATAAQDLRSGLGAALERCSSFEECSTIVLTEVLRTCGEKMVESMGAVLLRAQVDLRARRARALAVQEVSHMQARWPDPDQVPQHGATAWRFVRRGQGAVALDVARKQLQRPGGGAAVKWEAEELRPDALASQAVYLRRQTTHLLAVPLFDTKGRLGGVVTVEVASTCALTELQPLWEAWLPDLEAIVLLAGPPLCLLPVTGTTLVELQVPVVGERMRGVLSTLQSYAQLDQLILLRGPTGVGKTHLAEWVHAISPRRDGPFIVADLLSVPDTGPEVALFGVVEGFFTGVRARRGWVEEARGGTLFIDEIDKLSMEVQSKLLRLLDRREYAIVGEGRTRRADLRLIVATNADLWQAVKADRFREDLYYRVDSLVVDIPPLRERRDEIAAWANYMLNRLHRAELARRGLEAEPISFGEEQISELVGREWPGNLRELDSVIRRAYAAHHGKCLPGSSRVLDLPSPPGVSSATIAASVGSTQDSQRSCRVSISPEDPAQTADQVAHAVYTLIKERRALGIRPVCQRKGDLAILDYISARVADEARQRHGATSAGLRELGIDPEHQSRNSARFWRQYVKGLSLRIK